MTLAYVAVAVGMSARPCPTILVNGRFLAFRHRVVSTGRSVTGITSAGGTSIRPTSVLHVRSRSRTFSDQGNGYHRKKGKTVVYEVKKVTAYREIRKIRVYAPPNKAHETVYD